ncbi:LysE family translocator [Acidisphaera sp. L21]|uniref:LysE family translocator n=1 Tax=Acidisphaera sp. L21 TaxID=1641851 RepID=UPI00131D254C|nr:LysE family translocator [Acidisphaera sp. L21]
MTIWLLLKGMGFGLAVAAPVGPMSLLLMRRTLVQGWRPGIATGAGIAMGDGLYACVAVLGLAGLSRFMLAHEQPLHFAAGLFLLYLGVRTVFARPSDTAADAPVVGAGRAFASAVLLTLTNPPTIIMFAAIFASMAPPEGFAAGSAAATVGGVLAGSMVWWCGVVAGVSAVRHAIGPRARRWIDRVAGAVLAVFGAVEIRRSV